MLKMTEYISREAVNDIIEDMRSNHFILMGERVHLAFLKSKITELPASDVQDIDRWISVEDRLPEIDERVLVYIPKPDNHYNIEIAYISKGNDDCPYWVLRDKSQFYSTRFRYVLRWQPLPESPKED